MIKVVIEYQNIEEGSFKSLTMNGHADSAPHGQDLVCAACSAIIVGGINAIDDDENFEYEVEEGHVLVKAKTLEISDHDKVVLDTIIMQLKTIEIDYAKFIKIEERN